MLAIERKNEILGRLRNEKRVLVSELAEYYNVTEETIRRDLDKLEKEGYATKTYGGAILGNSTKTDLSYAVRNKANVEAKKVIANLVTDLIEDGDHLMIDHSSTCYFSVKKLKEKKNLTVITNSLLVIREFPLDEVEAALDDANLSKLIGALDVLRSDTQLLVISHQRRTMEDADVLYGVSMQADGVSRVVSQKLDRETGKVVNA